MFCKSGILIFIFAENNYSIYAHTMLIKTPLLHQNLVPVSCFLSFSLSLSGYFFGGQRLSEFTFLPELLRPSREGALCLHPIERCLRPLWTEQAPCRGFIGFLCNPRNISLFLYPLLSYQSTPDHQVPVH